MSAARGGERPRTVYLLVGSKEGPLARAELFGPADGINLQLSVLDGDPDALVNAELIQAVPMDNRLPMKMGRIILRRGDLVVMEPLKGKMADARKNLRMPVSFESFIYFPEGGRALILAENLSCGGIAFYAETTLEVGQTLEVVVPITSVDPAVVCARVLRVQPGRDQAPLYACKFTDLLPEEEARLREAVFHAQVKRGKGLAARK